jgi:putative oxidoreductase
MYLQVQCTFRANLTMKISNSFLLRAAVAVILIMHSIPTILDGSVNQFGSLYLNTVGFNPIGVPLAWIIKLSHVACAICLLVDKYVKWASFITIVILLAGIIMLHGKEGWFVLGRGHDGVEFNFLLIVVLVTIAFPKGLTKQT